MCTYIHVHMLGGPDQVDAAPTHDTTEGERAPECAEAGARQSPLPFGDYGWGYHQMSLPLDSELAKWLSRESTRRRVHSVGDDRRRRTKVGIVREAVDDLQIQQNSGEPLDLELRKAGVGTKAVQFNLNDRQYAFICAMRDEARERGVMAYLSDVIEMALRIKRERSPQADDVRQDGIKGMMLPVDVCSGLTATGTSPEDALPHQQ